LAGSLAVYGTAYATTTSDIDMRLKVNPSNFRVRPDYRDLITPVPVPVPQPIEEELLDEWLKVAERAWRNWKPTPDWEPTPGVTPIPYPLPYHTPTPQATCTSTPEPDVSRLVELGTGLDFERRMAFEILYENYKDNFDEFVAVEDQSNPVIYLQRLGRIPASPNIYHIKHAADIPSQFADFLFAMSPGPSLSNFIQNYGTSIAKNHAIIWFILDKETIQANPNLIQNLELQGFTIIEHPKSDKLGEDNLFGLPLESRWIDNEGGKWVEVYKDPGGF
jgi:hypothetical protein